MTAGVNVYELYQKISYMTKLIITIRIRREIVKLMQIMDQEILLYFIFLSISIQARWEYH